MTNLADTFPSDLWGRDARATIERPALIDGTAIQDRNREQKRRYKAAAQARRREAKRLIAQESRGYIRTEDALEMAS